MPEQTYLPSMSLDAYQSVIAADHPLLHALIDPTRLETAANGALRAGGNEFDSDSVGRGDSYRRAQQDPCVRWTGARRLLSLAVPPDTQGDITILDVLGGDGTIARAAAAHDEGTAAELRILTGDLSGPMVERALAYGLPAVRQSADALLLRSNCVDSVLLAYGTHHIPPADRPRAIGEALRVVRPGGRVVVHDFDASSPMARFFSDVVHPCTKAGHAYAHFDREGMRSLFAGLDASVRVTDLYDPLIIHAPTADEARHRMCTYIADMYGVHAFFGTRPQHEAWTALQDCFDHTDYRATLPREVPGRSRPAVYPSDHGHTAEVPRIALVAIADKHGAEEDGRTPTAGDPGF